MDAIAQVDQELETGGESYFWDFNQDEQLDPELVANLRMALHQLGYLDTNDNLVEDQASVWHAQQSFSQDLGILIGGAPDLFTQVAYLRIFTGYDGSPELDWSFDPLVVGEKGLLVRVLQYRLGQLGLFQGAPTGTFDGALNGAVAQWFQIVGRPLDEIAVDSDMFWVLGNPWALNRVFSQRLGKNLISFSAFELGPGLTLVQPDQVVLVGDEGVFSIKSRFFWVGPKQPEVAEYLLGRTALVWIQLYLSLNGEDNAGSQGFATSGTVSAIQDLLKDHQLDPNLQQQNEYLLMDPATNKVWVAPALFQVMGFHEPSPEQLQGMEQQLNAFVIQNVQQPKPPEKPGIKTFFKSMWDRVKHWTGHLFRTGKAMVLSLGRVIGRGAQWLWQFLQKSVAMTSLAIATVKRQVGMAIGLFFSRLKRFLAFLESGRIVTRAGPIWVISQYCGDMDGICLFHGPAAGSFEIEALAANHRAELNSVAASFSLTTRVIEIGLALSRATITGPVGWWQLGLFFLGQIKALISDPKNRPYFSSVEEATL